MIKVGLTGQMGSGKSYCARLFERLGVPVFYTDDVAREVINTNKELKNKIVSEFGEVYDSDGKMIPSKIRNIVFTDDVRLLKLNELSHPYVFKEFEKFCDRHNDKQYILAESAILFETKLRDHVDEVIYVNADEKLRIKRTFERSGFSEIEYRQRMKNQLSSDYKISMSDFVITNNDDDDVKKQVEEINNKLNEL